MNDRKRLVAVSVFLFLLFCLLVVRFYQIQIIEGEKWTQVALSQHQYISIEPFMRGSFYSNTSVKEGHPEELQPFVIDVPKFHLYADPDAIPLAAKGELARELSRKLSLSLSRVRLELGRKSRSRKIAAWLDRKTRNEIEIWWRGFAKKGKIARNALYFISDYKRSYPFGSMLGSVLHTVQEERDPKTLQSLPTGGLEMLCNSYLQGKLGRKLILRSPRRPLDTGKILEAPENGADVYLTINHYLQAIAETELAKGVQAARAKGGWAVMMDPYSGEILALAQYPFFDPSQYAKYFNDPDLQEHTRVKAVSDCFEPGSIFKPITLAVCLKANEELFKRGRGPLFTPSEKIPTANGWFPGRSAPLKDGRRHSYLNMDLALQKSSNVYMGRIVHRMVETLGNEWYRQALSEFFGFGKKTGIELPAENPGLLPTPGKLHPNGKLEWSLPTPYSLAIGHNILVNSIQMVRMYAMLANGGYGVQPHLIRKIVKTLPDGTQKILVDQTSMSPPKQILRRDTVEAIVHAMKFVTKRGGTSTRGDIMGYTEAGKSGTSEKILHGTYSKEHYIASFVGFTPATHPRFVLLVSIDEPEKKFIPGVGKNYHGGICAAPVFREIAARALQYLGVAPDDPYGYPYGDPRRKLGKADWAYEIEALKQIYDEWN